MITSGTALQEEATRRVQPIRIELKGKSAFLGRAFHVEWGHQFPDRELVAAGPDCFLIEAGWLDDVEQVAVQCFCDVKRAPDNPRRRRWMSSLVRGRGDD